MYRAFHSIRLPLGQVGLVALLLASAGCKQEQAVSNVVDDANNLIADIPVEPQALDRAAILSTVATAASNYAAGVDDQSVQASLDGKRIAFRIPFGCASDPSMLASNLKLAVRPNGKAFEVAATPDISIDDIQPFFPPPPVDATEPATSGSEANAAAAVAKPAIEAAEGFWIARPWMLTDKCPAAAPVPAPEAERPDDGTPAPTQPTPEPASPTVGIVQYYGPNDNRVGFRDGRSFSKIEAIGALSAAPTAGATLVLEGRLRHWPNGKVIQCRGDGLSGTPQCLVSATMDHISIVRADDGKTIAEWTR